MASIAQVMDRQEDLANGFEAAEPQAEVVPLVRAGNFYITIGNSDDKLSQHRWSKFCASVIDTCNYYASEVFIVGHTKPDDPWQTMIVSVELPLVNVESMQEELRNIKRIFQQESIAWAKAEVTFL